ncbi:MAG: tetratricopeptide repeat protein, partial [Candidatus Omnitrophica bacterium]|nr:tetratricopeptide repeat protein [Candidatus Omnitrophota bacterium]
VSFLREGLTNNPDSWKLNAELGRIYFKHLKKYESAIRFLTRARDLLQEAPHDRFEERYVLSFLAYSYEALGRADEALPLHRRIAQLFPMPGTLKEGYEHTVSDGT